MNLIMMHTTAVNKNLISLLDEFKCIINSSIPSTGFPEPPGPHLKFKFIPQVYNL